MLTFFVGQHFYLIGTNLYRQVVGIAMCTNCAPKLYRQVVGIAMGTNCAPLNADLFFFCYESDFMMSLSDDKQANIIGAFNTTSRYVDDI